MAPSSVTLHGHPASPYNQRAAMLLHEVGEHDFSPVMVNPVKGDTRSPAFLELNPFGKIPVYEDESGILLSESRAICRYLLEKFPDVGAELMGRTIAERAMVNRWVDLETNVFTISAAAIVGEGLIKKVTGAPVDKARLKEQVEKLSAVLDILDKHLGKQKFLVGDRITFADLTHLPHTAMLPAAGQGALLTSRPNVARWWVAISARPSWAKVMEGPTLAKLAKAAAAAKPKA